MHSFDSVAVTRFSGLVYFGLLLLTLLTRLISPYDLLVLFWLELLIIGCFALLKLLTALFFGDPFSGRYVDSTRGATLLLGTLMLGLFVVKFGAIALGLGLVLLWMPLGGDDLPFNLGKLGPWVGLCFWYLLASYALNFVWHYLRHKDYRRVSVLWLLFSPYLRAVVIGITLIIASLAALHFEGRAYLALCLVLVVANAMLNLLFTDARPNASLIHTERTGV